MDVPTPGLDVPRPRCSKNRLTPLALLREGHFPG